MAEQEPVVGVEEEEVDAGYKKPAERAMADMLNQDQDDESLVKYKKSLLSETENVVFWPETDKRVIVKKLSFVTEGRPDVELDLTGDLEALKAKTFKIKEGCTYRLKITFCVQREIVTGLKYNQKTSRKGIKVDKQTWMVGSYAPKREAHEFLTPADEAPSGMLSRGHYKLSSKFLDDDNHVYLNWEWAFDISKDWD